MNVVLQPNSSDCGLFALANASALASNLDPVSCNWNVQEMRGHLYNCFETGRLAPFPFQPRKVSISRKVVRSKSEDVFCVCRLPEEPNDEFIPMVQCFTCQEWFHETCIKVNAAALKTVLKWKCMDCNNMLF